MPSRGLVLAPRKLWTHSDVFLTYLDVKIKRQKLIFSIWPLFLTACNLTPGPKIKNRATLKNTRRMELSFELSKPTTPAPLRGEKSGGVGENLGHFLEN